MSANICGRCCRRRQLETINVAFVLRRMTFGFCDNPAAASQTNANGYDKSPPPILMPLLPLTQLLCQTVEANAQRA